MPKPVHIREVLKDTLHSIQELYQYPEAPGDMLSHLKAQIRQRGIHKEMSSQAPQRPANCETGGIEYHIQDYLDEAEDVLWAIQLVDQESGVTNGYSY